MSGDNKDKRAPLWAQRRALLDALKLMYRATEALQEAQSLLGAESFDGRSHVNVLGETVEGLKEMGAAMEVDAWAAYREAMELRYEPRPDEPDPDRCIGQTQRASRCRISVKPPHRFCGTHRYQKGRWEWRWSRKSAAPLDTRKAGPKGPLNGTG